VSNDPFADVLRMTEAKSVVAGRAVAGVAPLTYGTQASTAVASKAGTK
jgi:hypothetical protein